jgi:hypothetical protein
MMKRCADAVVGCNSPAGKVMFHIRRGKAPPPSPGKQLPPFLRVLWLWVLIVGGPVFGQLTLGTLGNGATVSGPPPSARIASFAERVDLLPDGTASVTVQATFLAGSEPVDVITLPMRFVASVTQRLAWVGSPAPEVSGDPLLETRSGVPLLKVRARQFAPGRSVALAFSYAVKGFFRPEKAATAKFGNLKMQWEMLNVGPVPITEYQAVVRLPPGFLVNRIISYLPAAAPGDEDVGGPVGLIIDQGVHALTLKGHELSTGATVMAQFEIKSAAKPWSLLVGLLVVAVLYLVFFRDLVSSQAEPKSP